MSEVEPPLRLILATSKRLIENKSLLDFMAVVLQLGNFLNSVIFIYFPKKTSRFRNEIFFRLQRSYAGNAKGFKLSALQQLTDLRANKPRITLLHYIVEMENDNPHLLDFCSELSSVKDAKRLSLETLASDVRSWKLQIEQVQNQLQNAESDVAEMMNGVLK